MLFFNNPIRYILTIATLADIIRIVIHVMYHVFMNANNILYDFAKPAFIVE